MRYSLLTSHPPPPLYNRPTINPESTKGHLIIISTLPLILNIESQHLISPSHIPYYVDGLSYLGCSYNYQVMGAVFPCCVSKESLGDYDNASKSVDMTMIPMFPKIRFGFSRAHGESLEYSDCVIVNASKKHPENQFYFKHLNPKQLETIKELITSQEPGTVQVITNPLESLPTKDIIVIHLPVWGQPNAEEDLVNAVNKSFEEALKRNHKLIVITEIEEERGIPDNVVYKVIINCVEKHQDKLERVVLNIESAAKLEYFKNHLTGNLREERAYSKATSNLSQ